MPLTVFVDANVLFSRCLRDWLVLLTQDSQYTAYELRWSEAVLAETFYHLRRKHPEAPERQVERWREMLDESCPAAKITGWDPRSVPRPADPDDHHVLAAAYAGGVDVLITCDGDITNFQQCLDQVGAGISVQHVDDFLCMIAERHPDLVRRRYLKQIMYWQHREQVDEDTAADSTLDALDKAGARTFSFTLRTDERFRIWSA